MYCCGNTFIFCGHLDIRYLLYNVITECPRKEQIFLTVCNILHLKKLCRCCRCCLRKEWLQSSKFLLLAIPCISPSDESAVNMSSHYQVLTTLMKLGNFLEVDHCTRGIEKSKGPHNLQWKFSTQLSFSLRYFNLDWLYFHFFLKNIPGFTWQWSTNVVNVVNVLILYLRLLFTRRECTHTKSLKSKRKVPL